MKKTPGTATYGDVSIDVEGEFGVFNTIRFSRPEYVPCIVELTIQSLPGYSSELIDVIKSQIVNYLNALSIGESLYVSNMFPAILMSSDGTIMPFYVKSLTVNSEIEIVEVGKFEALSCSLEDVLITVI